ncbi:hypothetical protein XA68_12627 [Ophiocordyceps unilateralis]|uniref:Uncharacterized protein n=1 Tax=Ophiocordyceps unilateralis TaxID=268505 RepID=A0A2A9PEK9_OPHUN|nr:hypothetical protein XA68_12627 [Ophiocordyceps unilateralis]
MGFGRKAPEISLLRAAFNVPTARDLKRQEQRREWKKAAARVPARVSDDSSKLSSSSATDGEEATSSEDEEECSDYEGEFDVSRRIKRLEKLGAAQPKGKQVEASKKRNDDKVPCLRAKASSEDRGVSKIASVRKAVRHQSPPRPKASSAAPKSKLKDKRSAGTSSSLPRERKIGRAMTTASVDTDPATLTCSPSANETHPLFFSQVAQPPLQATFPVQPFPYPSQLSDTAPKHCSYPFPVCQNTATCFVHPQGPSDGPWAQHALNCHETPACQETTTRASTQPSLVDLQRIQYDMDQVKTRLLSNSEDQALQNELVDLQTKLNSALNLATARPVLPAARRSSDNAPANTGRSAGCRPKPSEAGGEKAVAADAPLLKIPEPERPNQDDIEQAPRETPNRVRAQSPGGAVRHHLCSGCGEVRSGSFHGKHPLSKCHKPLLNYCSPCKDNKIERGVIMDRHHFCFGCGVVRSKAFQRRNAATVEGPLLPNYCGKCQQEVRDAETIVDVSVVNSDIPSFPSQTASFVGSDDRLTRSMSLERSSETERLTLHRRRKAKRTPEVRPVNPRLESTSPEAGPTSSSKTSFFCPDRTYGSAQRRAQRGDGVQEVDFVRPVSAASDRGAYQQPYVEDVETVTAANQKVWTSPEQKGHGRTASMSDPYLDGAGSDRQTLRGKADGRKTVKFRSAVNVRRSKTQQSSDTGRQDESCGMGPGLKGTAWAGGKGSRRNSTSQFYTKSNRPVSIFQDEEDRKSHSPGPDNRHSWPSSEAVPGPEPAARHWKGAFGKDFGPFADAWASFPPSLRHWRGRDESFDYHDRVSPTTEGFPPDVSAMFAGDKVEEVPSTRSSRGAFGPGFDAFGPSFAGPTEGERGYRTDSSSPPMSRGNDSSSYRQQQQQQRRQTHTSRDVHGDNSASSSNNPYYKPSRFFASMKGFAPSSPCPSGEQTTTTTRAGNDEVPQPIIEEPDSPPASPERKTRLLDFHAHWSSASAVEERPLTSLGGVTA